MQLYNGDCLIEMDKISDKTIDLVYVICLMAQQSVHGIF